MGQQRHDGAHGGQFCRHEAQHVQQRQHQHPAAHERAEALAGQVRQAASRGQRASDGSPAPRQHQKGQRRADGVARQRHWADEGPDFGGYEQDPRAQPGGQKRPRQRARALRAAGGQVVVEGGVGGAGAQPDPQKDNQSRAHGGHRHPGHVALPPPVRTGSGSRVWASAPMACGPLSARTVPAGTHRGLPWRLSKPHSRACCAAPACPSPGAAPSGRRPRAARSSAARDR